MRKVIISTVGSSLITNKFSNKERNEINAISNFIFDELIEDKRYHGIIDKIEKTNYTEILLTLKNGNPVYTLIVSESQ